MITNLNESFNYDTKLIAKYLKAKFDDEAFGTAYTMHRISDADAYMARNKLTYNRKKNTIDLMGDTPEEDTPIYKVRPQYSSKKVQGTYAPKLPKIIPIDEYNSMYGESYMREERYYDLAPQKRDTRKSFYGKAKVIDKGNGEYELISYNTPVACVKDGKVVYADLRKYSATTDRHIREFLAQYCDECNESYKRESTEEIEPGNIYDIAVKTLPKEDIDHHASDLYLRKTPESTALINKMKYRNSGLLSTFRDNIDGDIWYELPFCYGFERSAAEREAELDRSVKQLKSIYGKESKRAVKREASSYRSYTKKQIKDYVTDGLAIDVTNYGFGQMNELLKSIDKEIVGVSHGTYGVNAVLFKDSKTGQLYAVCARNTASQMVI